MQAVIFSRGFCNHVHQRSTVIPQKTSSILSFPSVDWWGYWIDPWSIHISTINQLLHDIYPFMFDLITVYFSFTYLLVFKPFWLLRTSQLPFDYSRNTIRRFHGYHSCDSADVSDDSDCADALKQIRRYPLTLSRKSFDDSAEILKTQQICGYCKVSCDMYCIFTLTFNLWVQTYFKMISQQILPVCDGHLVDHYAITDRQCCHTGIALDVIGKNVGILRLQCE